MKKEIIIDDVNYTYIYKDYTLLELCKKLYIIETSYDSDIKLKDEIIIELQIEASERNQEISELYNQLSLIKKSAIISG